eukprot:TRINITY_DN9724_c0_g1_i8.p1 TRINITY_DN9724_c0_g1~~TRINITY_DN9724_c0_g1_i8.p1  ORF type:complete len:458 (+),score=100.38 TRINITY_DN9724_c0_g1_i8:979-2352(+)
MRDMFSKYGQIGSIVCPESWEHEPAYIIFSAEESIIDVFDDLGLEHRLPNGNKIKFFLHMVKTDNSGKQAVVNDLLLITSKAIPGKKVLKAFFSDFGTIHRTYQEKTSGSTDRKEEVWVYLQYKDPTVAREVLDTLTPKTSICGRHCFLMLQCITGEYESTFLNSSKPTKKKATKNKNNKTTKKKKDTKNLDNLPNPNSIPLPNSATYPTPNVPLIATHVPIISSSQSAAYPSSNYQGFPQPYQSNTNVSSQPSSTFQSVIGQELEMQRMQLNNGNANWQLGNGTWQQGPMTTGNEYANANWQLVNGTWQQVNENANVTEPANPLWKLGGVVGKVEEPVAEDLHDLVGSVQGNLEALQQQGFAGANLNLPEHEAQGQTFTTGNAYSNSNANWQMVNGTWQQVNDNGQQGGSTTAYANANWQQGAQVMGDINENGKRELSWSSSQGTWVWNKKRKEEE